MTSRHYGARYHLTFRAWLYQHQQAHGAIGNMARAIAVDHCLPAEDARRIVGYMRHFQQVHTATAEDIAALQLAWDAYQREVCSHV